MVVNSAPIYEKQNSFSLRDMTKKLRFKLPHKVSSLIFGCAARLLLGVANLGFKYDCSNLLSFGDMTCLMIFQKFSEKFF